ncbi:Uncharacterized protein OBRU01_23186, partial [Operophtera brumata]
MYHRVRKKMCHFFSAILILSLPLSLSKSIETTTIIPDDNEVNNNIIDFDEEYTVKFNKKYGSVPWHANDFDKNSLRYTIVKDINKNNDKVKGSEDWTYEHYKNESNESEYATTEDFRVIPLELISTTEDPLISLIESTTEQDLTVIPLSTTEKIQVTVEETVSLPSTVNYVTEYEDTTEHDEKEITSEATTEQSKKEVKTSKDELNATSTVEPKNLKVGKHNVTIMSVAKEINSEHSVFDKINATTMIIPKEQNSTIKLGQINLNTQNKTKLKKRKGKSRTELESKEEDVPIFTELDTESIEDIPDDYYDSKDIVPTSAPKTDAISVLFGLAGSVVESVVETVAERVVPKSIYDLFKRMQRQNEALEAERLRSREENGGLGQFGRGILKTISTGLSKPLSQLMESKENGSLDTDRGFVASVASSVTSVANVANSVVDAFKDKVQAIYPGTVWCGDGHSAQARSSDLGLFFFTDTCCRQHDACKIYIKAGETKYGLTNTGLFTSSLVSAQIGLTYFNVLGPQCFRRAHPIVKCLKKT